MKHCICFFVAAFVLISAMQQSVFAQEKQQKEKMKQIAANETAQMQEKLFLTEAQTKQVMSINLQYNLAVEKLVQGGITPDLPAQKQALDTQKQAELNKVLDPQQAQLNQRMTKSEEQAAKEFYAGFVKEQLNGNNGFTTAVTAYAQQNILPTLTTLRTDFDSQLEEADRQNLVKYRAETAKVVEEILNTQQQMNAEGENSTLKMKMVMMRLARSNKETAAALRQMEQKYAAQIDDYMIKMMPEQQRWEADLKNIADAFLTKSEGQQLQKLRLQADAYGVEYLGSRIGFLLFDPANTDTYLKVLNRQDVSYVYPNPSNGRNSVNMKIQKETQVRINLISDSGAFLKMVYKQTHTPGSYDVALDVSDLQNGQYYYAVYYGTQVQTIRFVVEK
ncbi:T9SS C-terminal target domain-containing protein [Sphingobacteriales bacterium UPWRP_1]|nr:hypothetical protein B6N25_05590 [Sphingobacteriales bacterium TSM_CSS]PSJ78362.1 T9SS C-terminal target domain-containing protein [Sphingobacteriales bacterium UPWRP_1]